MKNINFIYTKNWTETIKDRVFLERWSHTHNYDYQLMENIEPVTGDLKVIKGSDIPDDLVKELPIPGRNFINDNYYYFIVATPTCTKPYQLVRAHASDRQRARNAADIARMRRYYDDEF